MSLFSAVFEKISASWFPLQVVGLDFLEAVAGAPAPAILRQLTSHVGLSALATPHQEPRSGSVYYVNEAIL